MEHSPVPTDLSPKAAFAFLNDPAYVWIDVREDEEWEYGHLPGIIHLPMSTLKPDDFSRFSKDQKLMMVCRSGSRSSRVTMALREMGYSHAQNLSGGMIGINSLLEQKIPVLMGY